MSQPVDESTSSYTEALLAWRDAQDKALRAADGWLTVVGLFWLQPGENMLGSASDAAVQLPPRLPARVGTLTVHDETVTLRALPGDTLLRIGGEPVQEAVLSSDDNHPTLVHIEQVTFFVIRRGDRLAIRMKDAESEARTHFEGRAWFPVDPDFRVTGEFTPHPSQRTLEVETVIGTQVTLDNPGLVTFTLGGVMHQLEAFTGDKSDLWFVFRDETSGVQTYGACRFLDAPLRDGRVELDFNKAVHPPCAFTPFATCPLPPRSNILPVALLAGERWKEQAMA